MAPPNLLPVSLYVRDPEMHNVIVMLFFELDWKDKTPDELVKIMIEYEFRNKFLKEKDVREVLDILLGNT